IDSWYKYLKMNQVVRPRLVAEKRKHYGQGIRATKPNELWHIDITEVKTQSFQKLYLQLIVDNFSRSIISFKTGYRKDLKLSLKTLKCLDDSRILRPKYVLTDGGKENVNSSVAKILIGKGVTHLVANSDVNFSNSIVEAVFRQMKRIPEIRNPRSLNMFQIAIQKYAQEHNFVIPHSSLKGSTPAELLSGQLLVKENNAHLQALKQKQQEIRSHQKHQCRVCIRKYHY
ncbi:MAG: DDE-type integrase/transposase/recombinase, partial [Bacteriovoracia bacterium]